MDMACSDMTYTSFFVMDTIATFEDHPYVQIYHGGKLLTDNLENLRHEIPN